MVLSVNATVPFRNFTILTSHPWNFPEIQLEQKMRVSLYLMDDRFRRKCQRKKNASRAQSLKRELSISKHFLSKRSIRLRNGSLGTMKFKRGILSLFPVLVRSCICGWMHAGGKKYFLPRDFGYLAKKICALLLVGPPLRNEYPE